MNYRARLCKLLNTTEELHKKDVTQILKKPKVSNLCLINFSGKKYNPIWEDGQREILMPTKVYPHQLFEGYCKDRLDSVSFTSIGHCRDHDFISHSNVERVKDEDQKRSSSHYQRCLPEVEKSEKFEDINHLIDWLRFAIKELDSGNLRRTEAYKQLKLTGEIVEKFLKISPHNRSILKEKHLQVLTTICKALQLPRPTNPEKLAQPKHETASKRRTGSSRNQSSKHKANRKVPKLQKKLKEMLIEWQIETQKLESLQQQLRLRVEQDIESQWCNRENTREISKTIDLNQLLLDCYTLDEEVRTMQLDLSRNYGPRNELSRLEKDLNLIKSELCELGAKNRRLVYQVDKTRAELDSLLSQQDLPPERLQNLWLAIDNGTQPNLVDEENEKRWNWYIS